MSDIVFLDTNIFVYAFMASDERKRSRAVQLIEGALGAGTGRISYQVVQEFANVARKKFAQRMTTADCTAFIDAAMQPMNRVASSTVLLLSALALQDELRYSFYDSLVLAAALQAGASTFYTEDLQHWQLVRGTLRIVNPFVDAVHEATA
ncbi:MAG: PIN domain-containing protein [Polaromonas sp.]